MKGKTKVQQDRSLLQQMVGKPKSEACEGCGEGQRKEPFGVGNRVCRIPDLLED